MNEKVAQNSEISKNTKFAFLNDSSRCIGCKACMIACKDKHSLPIGVKWRKVLECSSGAWNQNPDGTYTQNVGVYYISVACNHCENALCVEACPTGATHKTEEGIVAINAEKCVACGNCKWNCPYSAPQLNKEKKHMTKCDLCQDYLAQGKKPACVAACPSRALFIIEREKIGTEYPRANVAPLPEASLTYPNFAIIPHRSAAPAQDMSVELANREEI